MPQPPLALVLALIALALATPALAAGGESRAGRSDPSESRAYVEGVKLLADGELEKARRSFVRAHRERPRDPDVLNMLAYTQRKSGDLEEAIKNYKRALRLRPDFPDAREYLGEAYLEAALAELAWLAEAGDDGKKQHGKLLRAIHDRTRGLEPPTESRSW